MKNISSIFNKIKYPLFIFLFSLIVPILLWRIKEERYQIKEIPIVWKHTENSSFSLKYAPKMLINLIKLRIGLI